MRNVQTVDDVVGFADRVRLDPRPAGSIIMPLRSYIGHKGDLRYSEMAVQMPNAKDVGYNVVVLLHGLCSLDAQHPVQLRNIHENSTGALVAQLIYHSSGLVSYNVNGEISDKPLMEQQAFQEVMTLVYENRE
jgi:hypothetical protein